MTGPERKLSPDTRPPEVDQPALWPLVRLIPGLAGFVVFLLFLQHARVSGWAAGPVAGMAVLAVAGAVALWYARKTLHNTLCSVPFAVVLLLTIAAATALGTFVPQDATPEWLHKHYGWGTAWVNRLFLTEVFRSLWFQGLVALLVLSLLLLVRRRPFWRPVYWGFVLGHGGMVVVVVGAAIGACFGLHGTLGVRVGQAQTEFALTEDNKQGRPVPLGFALKLNAFDVERYPDEVRFSMYSVPEEGHPELVGTAKLDRSRDWTPVPKSEYSFRVRDYYPDIDLRKVVKASSEPHLPAGARVRLECGAAVSEEWLFAGIAGADTLRAPGLEVQFVWSADAANDGAWLQRTAQAQPARHVLEVAGQKASLEVRVGETYTLPGTQRSFRVVEFLPDFYYDIERKRGASRSNEPNNPTLVVEELPKEPGGAPHTQYLSARMPGHGQKPDDLPLRYVYFPAEPAIACLVRVDGRAKQLVLASGGKEVLRKAFELGQHEKLELPAGTPNAAVLEVAELFEHARPEMDVRTRSQELRNPGAMIEIRNRKDGAVVDEQLLLALDEEECVYRLPGGAAIVFEKKEGEVRAYRSHVAIIDGGKVVKEAIVAVNAPLSYGGYEFYQSNWDPNDLNCTGLTVVHDPGLGLVYAGMIMVSLGVAFAFYVRPRLV